MNQILDKQILEHANGITRRLALRSINDEIVFLSEQLPKRSRVMMTMKFRDGYTNSEIASLIGVVESTIYSRIKRILENEIKQLRKEEHESIRRTNNITN